MWLSRVNSLIVNSFVIAIQRNEINYGFPPVAQLVSLVYIYEVTRILEDKYADFLLFLPHPSIVANFLCPELVFMSPHSLMVSLFSFEWGKRRNKGLPLVWTINIPFSNNTARELLALQDHSLHQPVFLPASNIENVTLLSNFSIMLPFYSIMLLDRHGTGRRRDNVTWMVFKGKSFPLNELWGANFLVNIICHA